MVNRRAALIESRLAEADVENDAYEAESSSDEEVNHLEEQDHQSESEQEQDRPGEGSDESFEEDEPPQSRRRRNDSGDSRKPEIITYYNRTKNGVDLVDKMCPMYDVARNSRRWPLTVFFDLLNLSALNALCIYTANKNYEPVCRRDFLIDLALAWMKPLAHKRIDNTSLPRTLTIRIKDFLGITYAETQPTTSEATSSNVVRRCHDCGRARNKSTRKMCTKCKKFICGDHLKIMCLSCAENNI